MCRSIALIDRYRRCLGPWLLAAGAIVSGACDKSQPGQAPPSVPKATDAVQPVTPSDVVLHVHKLRRQRKYTELRDWIVPDRASATMDFLLAMDHLLAANAAAQEAIKAKVPTAPALEWDLSRLADLQGVFSSRIRVISETKESPRATVMIEVADQLPLEQVNLHWTNGRWLLVSDAGLKLLPEPLMQLAEGLRHVTTTVQSKPVTIDEIREEFRVRVGPRLRHLQDIAQEQARRNES
jgi:hypothetical protein